MKSETERESNLPLNKARARFFYSLAVGGILGVIVLHNFHFGCRFGLELLAAEGSIAGYGGLGYL